ncbi:MAG: AAA family ATPase [Candidatus Latescibacterota bacterium]|jgi:predicted kinase
MTDTASACGSPDRRRRLIVVCGLSFAGKSTLADALCAAFGHAQVDVDQTKDALYGPGVDDCDLNSAAWQRIYEETDRRTGDLLRDAASVVDGSRGFRRRERDRARSLAESTGAEMVLIHVDTPEAVARRRWAANRAARTRRDVSEQAFEEIVAVMEPPAPDEGALVFRHGDNITRWLTEYAGDLR